MNNNKLTTHQYIKRLKAKNITYYPMSEYYGMERSIKHGCEKGHEFEAKPRNVLAGYKCPSCFWWRTNKS